LPLLIEILEILPEKEEEVKPLPKGRPNLREQKAKMLAEMIRERRERKQEKKRNNPRADTIDF
jgi:mRNA-degrading endonuclease RelE of RelBE toxin-antitoxin system